MFIYSKEDIVASFKADEFRAISRPLNNHDVHQLLETFIGQWDPQNIYLGDLKQGSPLTFFLFSLAII